MNFGDKELLVKAKNQENEEVEVCINVALFIINDLGKEFFAFKNETFSQIYQEFVRCLEDNSLPDNRFFTNHENTNLRETAINLLSSPFVLSENWDKMHHIYVPQEEDAKILEQSVRHSVLSFKLKKTEEMLGMNAKEIKEETDEDNLLILPNIKYILTHI